MYKKLDQSMDNKIAKTMSYNTEHFQKTLQSCLRHRDVPTKTTAAKMKNTTGKSTSFLATESSMDDMIVADDNNEKERKKKAEQLGKDNKMEKNERKAEGQRLRAVEGKKKQTEETRRIADLTDAEAIA